MPNGRRPRSAPASSKALRPNRPVSLWICCFLGLLASAALGTWMMAAPAVLGSSGLPSDIQRLGGALVVTVAVIAMAEPVRLLRLANILLGATLAIGPWAAGATGGVRWNAFAIGFIIMILSAPRGPEA